MARPNDVQQNRLVASIGSGAIDGVVTWIGTIDDGARPNSSRQHASGERNETGC
jgi:hypothetical protein